MLPNTLELFGHIENKTILVAIIRSLKVEDRFLNNQQVIMNYYPLLHVRSKQANRSELDRQGDNETIGFERSRRRARFPDPRNRTEQNRTNDSIKQTVGRVPYRAQEIRTAARGEVEGEGAGGGGAG